MDIRILELIGGAKLAEGLTVVIDVFRAFSLECYLFARGAKEILPVGDINEAFALKREDENRVLIGERHGKKCEGCDFGNSPSQTAGLTSPGARWCIRPARALRAWQTPSMPAKS